MNLIATKKIIKNHAAVLLVVLFLSSIFIIISLVRHYHYYSQGNDLAIFDQTAWLYSQNIKPNNTITDRLDYQDRYKPIMILIGLVYRIVPGPQTLLILQSLSLGFSGLFLYGIARNLKLTKVLALLITTLYLIFPGITSFIIDDFHEVSLFPFFFLGSIHFFSSHKKIPTIIFLVLSLIIRDYLTVFSFVFWLSVIFIGHQFRQYPLRKLILAIHILMVSIMIIAIKITGGIEYGSFTSEGDSLPSTLITFFVHPQLLLQKFFIPNIKFITLLTSIGYFLFLPVLSLNIFIPALFQFAGRFLDSVHPYRWTINYHYSGELAALLAFGTVYQLSFMPKKKQYAIAIAMCLSSLLIIKYQHTPLTLIFKSSFWQKQEWTRANNKLIEQIPATASVATQNNLAPHLSNRQFIYIFSQNPQADYVLIDLHPNQDQYNFNGLTYPEMNQLQSGLTKNYQLIKRLGDSYLYAHRVND